MAQSPSPPRRARGAEASTFGADFVLLDPSGDMLRGLNPSGRRVWELIDGVRTASEIARLLAAEWAIDLSRAESDVARFLDALSARGLVERD